uniref:NADH dehydrogenase subunit 4L n=1 Tax=Rhabditophanes sp. KR3021 TaxID=114890 RepID=A0AC35UI94_9BILA
MIFFYFICFSVISSVLGIVLIVGQIKYYGSDLSVF